MLINGKEVTVEEAIEKANVSSDFLERRENGLLLSNYQIEVLKRNQINYRNYQNLSSLIFKIEEILNENSDEELEEVAKILSEINYYNDINK